MLSNFTQIGVLGGKDAAIRESNVKQAAEKVLEHRSIVCEQPTNLAGIAFKPGGALSCEVENQPYVFRFPRGNLEHLAKGGDLVASDDAVGRSHLGAKGDHSYGKRDPATRVVIRALAVAIRVPARNVARGASEQCAEGAAEWQLAGAGNNATNKTHGVRSNRYKVVNCRRTGLFG
jgi:hypothetical protein